MTYLVHENSSHLGAEQVKDLAVTEQVPPSASEFVIADSLGVGHLRTLFLLF
ncbi:hypothetical protein RHGRI_004342 [Rhododendron griersonianum]|uniref:Uncharacterized protein n=1 Tax=Rhododendron griersonianum TaxID=479676 RepID=A0AAV6LAY7_9ERIC|nr:hypothetical protein RHGRI_004342 [Rhododendron griersonianum]